MPVPLFFLFLLIAPLVELYLLIQVGSVIGALPTILLSIFTAVLGAGLVRMEGLSVLFRVQQTLARREVPALEMMEGAVLLVAGVLLFFPGFITDTVGFLLLVPQVRRWLILVLLRRGGAMVQSERGGRIRVIEGEFRRDGD